MRHTITSAGVPISLGLTERGRIRAALITLDQRWASLTDAQRAEALGLLCALSAVIRAHEVRAIA